MAIVPLDKLTVYGTSEQKSKTLEGLQQLGCLHLINLQSSPTQHPELISKESREALRYLTLCPMQRRQTISPAQFDRNLLVTETLQIKQQREELDVERDHLRKAIADLVPWGDFTVSSTSEADCPHLWFYVLPRTSLSDLPKDMLWYVANTQDGQAYVIVLGGEDTPTLPFSQVELDPRSLSQLRERLEAVEEELEELHWMRVTRTRWRTLLKQDLDAADDMAARIGAAEGALEDGAVFALQAWTPRMATPDVKRFAELNELALTVDPVTSDDDPPTLLKNPERVAGAEDCVKFYITPNYHAWDPTTVVFFSFSLFFAMIVSDAGYGLLMAALLFLFRSKLSGNRRTRNLLVGIVTGTILYGVIVGSYFGIEPASDTILGSFMVRIDGDPIMSNQNAMMVISVAIGVAHLVLANVISAWQQRRTSRSLGHLGWGLFMLGGFLLGSGSLVGQDSLKVVGEGLAIGGAIAIFLFSSEQPLFTNNLAAHLRRLLDGAMQFANLSKAFGDALSYLRLFALGLASAQLAVTFNGLASDASAAGGLGVLLAVVILTVGHGINFLLGLMSGTVHGLRLNCIEFFNWSLTEEGYSFQAFRKKAAT